MNFAYVDILPSFQCVIDTAADEQYYACGKCLLYTSLIVTTGAFEQVMEYSITLQTDCYPPSQHYLQCIILISSTSQHRNLFTFMFCL